MWNQCFCREVFRLWISLVRLWFGLCLLLWLNKRNFCCCCFWSSRLFQTGQHGLCAGLPRAAKHWGDHGLRAWWKHPLGELAQHQHGADCESHGRTPQCPRAIHILSVTSYLHHAFISSGDLIKHISLNPSPLRSLCGREEQSGQHSVLHVGDRLSLSLHLWWDWKYGQTCDASVHQVRRCLKPGD